MPANQVTQIAIVSSVKLTRVLGNGPSTQTNNLLETSQVVDFDSYSEGTVVLPPSTANYPLVPSSELVLITSDKPVDVLLNPGPSQVLIPATRRFSIDTDADVAVQISNTSTTDSARVSFLTTSKPAPTV